MASLTLAQARRIALAAQGFADPRPAPFAATARHLRRVIDRVQILQIDSVNVLARSHYLPVFARLGPYDPTLLDRARDGVSPRSRTPRTLVEYWAHEASLIPTRTWPLLGFRMSAAADSRWGRRVRTQHHAVLEAVAECVARHGPATSRQVEALLEHDTPRSRESWGWNWSVVKDCLEYLFLTGTLTSAGRTAQFERRYAVPSRVLPPDVLAQAPGAPTALPEQEAAIELIRLSARAHGLGTERCLRDYFRLGSAMARPAIAHMVSTGQLEQVRVRGWDRPVYLDPAARQSRSVPARALLSPFDSLVWQRQRTEELFGFRYRIEIYVPQQQRVYGYYVLPFLLDGALVARVDLKSDRAAGTLRVQAVHLEPDAPDHTKQELTAELRLMADWLQLDRVVFA